jgi:uncharacterized metal-binding protein
MMLTDNSNKTTFTITIESSVGKVLLFRPSHKVDSSKKEPILSTFSSKQIESANIEEKCSFVLHYELVNFAGGDLKIILESSPGYQQEVQAIKGNHHQ